ncbi:hypothetical protein C8A01DRAFT_48531 [Parachaetomium inaequale]|uniref:Uncharacterized protein n=1 Tax=Parachaetomium inaequale TaxID=2588326 RepID=A0AAN6SNS0_9PEZI|nr:hypothetical protein C8A01DRAFT_48531 [Parachaetomium inaequale]
MISGPGRRFPIPTIVTAADLRREAEKRAKNIVEHWETLRGLLQRHEATIDRRWTKKSKKQRLKTILEVWPDMPYTHRPDFNAFRKETEAERNAGTKFRKDYLWPYVNQEDLAKPKHLVLLMNARGRHLPSAFAAADADATKFGFVTKAVVPVFLDGHTMILNGVTEDNLTDYGKVLAWEDDKHARDWVVSGKQFMAGEGLLVLEIQERLLAFLVGCCREILHDIPTASLVSNEFPIQPEPAITPSREAVGFESLSVMAAEAPYRVPAELNLAKIESLLAARAGAAEDQLWALREDPLYFAHQLLEMKEHRPEMLNDGKGSPHPFTKGLQADKFWTVVLGDFLNDVFLYLEAFSELRQQAGELRAMQARHETVMSPADDLPDDYNRALIGFRYYLKLTATSLLQRLKLAGPGSPALRHLFLRNASTHADSRLSLRLCLKPGSDVDLESIGLGLAVDELERLVEAEPEAGELISSYMAELIGDISMVAQCLRAVEGHHPWARTFTQEHTQRSAPWNRITDSTKFQYLRKAVKLVEPFKLKFSYPVDKRRTKQNFAGDISNTATGRLLSQSRAIQRTPEWVEPQQPSAEPKPPAVDPVNTLYKALSTLYFGPETNHPSTTASDGSHKKTKSKTKRTPKPPPPSNPPTTLEIPRQFQLQPPPLPPPYIISVPHRALKVFHTLFHNPATHSTSGEVAWADFLYAMAAARFTAHKLYGSVWQFQPRDLTTLGGVKGERAIQFHEPHPKGKVPFWVARRFGRRLQRAYWWGGDVFVLNG